MKKITLESLLEEAKKEICEIEEGQVYETMNSIYPGDTISPFDKNVVINDVKMTLPLASSSRAKREFKKNGSSLKTLFKEGIKGDYLLVEKVEGENIICKNMSISEDYFEKYYKSPSMQQVIITKEDIATGNVKRVYRGFKNHLEGKNK
jgi:hypothetical protein